MEEDITFNPNISKTTSPFENLKDSLIALVPGATDKSLKDFPGVPASQLKERMENIQHFVYTQARLMQVFRAPDLKSVENLITRRGASLPPPLQQLPTRSHKAVNNPLADFSPQITVNNCDVIEVAASYASNDATVIQNPGNPKLPGYYGLGANALEEQLCFHSDLAFRLAPKGSGYELCNQFIEQYILAQFVANIRDPYTIGRDFFEELDPTQEPENNAQRWFKLFQLAAKQTASLDYNPPYLRNVAFVMPRGDIRFFDVKTSFGMDLQGKNFLTKPPKATIKEHTRKQYEELYQQADAEGAVHICAVALGCGAFKNNPDVIASAIKEVPKPNASVTFAILEPGYLPSLGPIGKTFDQTLNPKAVKKHSVPKPSLKSDKLLTLGTAAALSFSFMLGLALVTAGTALTLTGVFSPIGAIASLMGTTLVMTPAALLLSNIAIWSALAVSVAVSSFAVMGSFIYGFKKGNDLVKRKHVGYANLGDEISMKISDNDPALGNGASYHSVLKTKKEYEDVNTEIIVPSSENTFNK